MVSALALFSSCQEPEYIEPTAERQGITSLTAYFTTGKYVDQALARLDVPLSNEITETDLPSGVVPKGEVEV